MSEASDPIRDEELVTTVEDNSAEPVTDPRNPDLGIDADSTVGTLDERAAAAEAIDKATGGSLTNNAQDDGFNR